MAFASSANATLVDWTADLSFRSGSGVSRFDNTLTGTFTYDADTGIVSNPNLVLSYKYLDYKPREVKNVSIASNASMQGGDTGAAFFYILNDGLLFKSSTGGTGDPTIFTFQFTSLSNAGGVLNPTALTLPRGRIYMESFSGTLTGVPQATPSAVPVPAAAWLFGSGLLGLVGLRRRKQTV